AASRARLYDGHEAPVGSRPRTCAGPSTIPQERAARNGPTQVHGASGVACDAGAIWPLLSTGRTADGEEFVIFRGVITGLLLTASLLAVRDFRRTASA